MNWGALFLIVLGAGVIIVGLTGSSKRVCQGLTGSSCDWFPGTGGATEGAIDQQIKQPRNGNGIGSTTGGTQTIISGGTTPNGPSIIDLLDQQLASNQSLLASIQRSNMSVIGRI